MVTKKPAGLAAELLRLPDDSAGVGWGLDAQQGRALTLSDRLVSHDAALGGRAGGSGGGSDGQGVGAGVSNLGAFSFDAFTVIAFNHASADS